MSKKSKDDFRNDFGSTDERRRENISDERSGTLSRRRFLGGMGAAAVAAAVGCKDRSPSGVDVDAGPDVHEDGGVDLDGGPDILEDGGQNDGTVVVEDGGQNGGEEGPDLSILRAFPGAEGAGALSAAGRGGQVIYVTNLNDSGSGSLREACLASGPRIVVFRVGGTITLNSSLEINNPYLTIAGQTAPGDGICIRGAQNTGTKFRVRTDQVGIRYVRFRIGDGGSAGDQTNSVDVNPSGNDLIIDHCSISWANDENITIYGGPIDRCTVQWCIISEPLNGHTTHESAPGHGYNTNFGGGDVNRLSISHCLFANASGRSPRSAGRHNKMDLVNCVIYNWGSRAAELAVSTRWDLAASTKWDNLIGNTFKWGPTSSTRMERAGIVTRSGTDRFLNNQLYLEDNIVLGMSSTDILGGTEVHVSDSERERITTDTPHPFPPIPSTILPREEAYQKVLDGAGCTLPVRDSVDERVISDVINGTGSDLKTVEDVGGWPAMSNGTPYLSTAGDGISDEWKLANGLDANVRYNAGPGGDAQEGPEIPGLNGWTYMDLFLAGIDVPT